MKSALFAIMLNLIFCMIGFAQFEENQNPWMFASSVAMVWESSTVPFTCAATTSEQVGREEGRLRTTRKPSSRLDKYVLPCPGAPKGVLCANLCAGEEGARINVCDGHGVCKPVLTFSCAPYQCRDGSCLLSCNSDDECATGHVCRSGDCLLKSSYCSDDPNELKEGYGRYVVKSDRGTINCYPYMCDHGACLQRCRSTADCYEGNACDAEGRCKPMAR